MNNRPETLHRTQPEAVGSRKQMKVILIFGAMVLLVSCDRSSQEQVKSVPEPETAYPDHFDQAWVMSSAWSGHMGVALAIHGDRYFYWMYSDVPVDANFPYTGTFRIDDGVLILEKPSEYAAIASGDKVKKIDLYSYRWRIVPGKLSMALHSTADDADDFARILIPDFQFDPLNPFGNQRSLKSEQDVTGRPQER